ncbi:MAG: adenylosuccinate lyase [Candidatus Yanofskybacteria bacterium CG10_big_fil_rev_8_21_14_0_10_37_15]|uniref:Adenylosuccinate lyase n=1 Tax=Candidatus Yanofskybacteria bacterium CG10_big_fil_rev_8_21_14_0_10_37_15 TaxID=1975097 RepID=A0A2H0R661_9BACT|nr:MAG: adenylosuccinate lyase [Candidatus Yanofskybacteria bacterium CG10_big_fil_rev_8_21_14_0_10_37_15]
MNELEALSPLDGRYRKYVEPLAKIFSEKGLMQHRVFVEGEYLIALSENPKTDLRIFSEEEKKLIKDLSDLSLKDAEIIKAIETKGYGELKPTRHDVKAVEYFIKLKLGNTSLRDSVEWVHFALTSEDVNNLAYALMLSTGVSDIIAPAVEKIKQRLNILSKENKDVPMLARTHGQPASPTTFGKEFKVFYSRLKRQLELLAGHSIQVKMNGATGNYNAHHIAYPNINWAVFTKEFIEILNQQRQIKLVPNLMTTQIEPHDTYAELFAIISRINVILLDFAQDIWRYISDDWIQQKAIESEVGSSTMPNKINPIDFENAEGNLGEANKLFEYFSAKLPISRLQRDLSDSTVERNFGVSLGHCLVAYKSLLRGLDKITVNKVGVIEALENHPEVISEAIQTVLRREDIEAPYEQLKVLTRGRKITIEDLSKFIDSLKVSDKVKNELKQIAPINYTGIAELLVDME